MRLIKLMMIINERKRFKVQDLAEECRVSKRTILRDLIELEELGVPLYSEVGASGGYQVLNERVLPPIYFTENEAKAIIFAGQSLQNYIALPFKNEVDSALNKFYYNLSKDVKLSVDNLRKRLMFYIPSHDIPVPFLQPMIEAAMNQSIVTITYDGETNCFGVEKDDKEREIQPIGIFTTNGLWFCPAYCFDIEDYLVFRIDQILSLSLAEDQSKRVNIDENKLGQLILPDGSNSEFELKVRLTSIGVKRCKTDIWLADSIKYNEDGSGMIDAKLSLSFLPWAVHYFLGLGTEAIVEQPKILKDEIKKEINKLIDCYKE